MAEGNKVLASAITTPILDDYEISQCIGQGGFSHVFFATNRTNGNSVAIKQIAKFATHDPHTWEIQCLAIQNEVVSLSVLKGTPHGLLDTYEDEENIFLVLTYIPDSSELFDILCERTYFPEREAAAIIATIVKTLHALHLKGVVHRDVKSENIMAKNHDIADLYLIDFGLSAVIEPGTKMLYEQCGSPGYVAPEILLGLPYGMAVDMWSLGVTSYILIAGFAPWNENLETSVVDQMVNGMYDFPAQEWGEITDVAKDFICSLLNVDPDLRMTSAEAVHHPFISYLISPFPEMEPTPNPRIHVMQDSKSLKAEFESQLKKAKAEFENQFQALQATHQASTQDLKDQHNAKVEQMQKKWSDTHHELTQNHAQQLKEARDGPVNQLESLRSENDHLTNQINELRALTTQLKNDLQFANQKQNNTDTVDEIEALIAGHTQMEELKEQHRKETEDLNNVVRGLQIAKAAEVQKRTEVEQKSLAISEKAADYKAKLDTIANHYRAQKAEFQSLAQQHAQLQKTEADAQRQLAQELQNRATHNAALREKFYDMQKTIAKMNYDNGRLRQAIATLKGDQDARGGKKCPNSDCGATAFSPGAKFCPECGTKFYIPDRQHVQEHDIPDALMAKPNYPARGRQSRFVSPSHAGTPKNTNLELKFKRSTKETFKVGTEVKVPIEVFEKLENGGSEPTIIPFSDLKAEVEGPEVPTFQLSGFGHKYTVKFKPNKSGLYTVKVTLRNSQLYSAKIPCTGETGVQSYIEGNKTPNVGHYMCTVVAVDVSGSRQSSGGDSNFQFRVESPQNTLANFKPVDNRDGTYAMHMDLLKSACDFYLFVQLDGQNIQHSPFHFRTL